MTNQQLDRAIKLTKDKSEGTDIVILSSDLVEILESMKEKKKTYDSCHLCARKDTLACSYCIKQITPRPTEFKMI